MQQHGRQTMNDVEQHYRLRRLEVVSDLGEARVHVGISEDMMHREAITTGAEPLAAAFAAIESLVEWRIELEEVSIRSMTPGIYTVGEVRARVNGERFTGCGVAPDIVNAGVQAYLHVLNKAVHARELEAAALEQASYLWGV
jgi:2-isopropylmalate synthase